MRESGGDAIQFCLDFMGMTFQDACRKLAVEPLAPRKLTVTIKREFSPRETRSLSTIWIQRAKGFIQRAQQKLIRVPDALDFLIKKNISVETARRFSLGWNEENLFEPKSSWGMDPQEDGKQWLPKGLVIPALDQLQQPCKIKIRRADHVSTDRFPKYWELSGSRPSPAIFGDSSKPVVLVEAEIDAILIQQEAGELCCSLALGGASKKPDIGLDELLRDRRILYALDFDEAGKSAYPFWRNRYRGITSWPSPKGKSPEEAFAMGVNLRDWIQTGLEKHMV